MIWYIVGIWYSGIWYVTLLVYMVWYIVGLYGMVHGWFLSKTKSCQYLWLMYFFL